MRSRASRITGDAIPTDKTISASRATVRYQDWPARLESFLREASARRFRYGAHDCCLFVADAVLAMTGEDIAAEIRSKYRNRREAIALAESVTGRRSIKALIIHSLDHLPSIPIAFAQRGDLLLMKNDSIAVLGLNGKALKAAKTGIATVAMPDAVRAWRV